MGDFKFFGKSDPGRIREINEDAWYVNVVEKLVVVCDGMGGHNAGEVASKLAIETIEKVFLDELPSKLYERAVADLSPNFPLGVQRLLLGIRLGNRRIFDLAIKNRELQGMGTTLVAAMFFKNKIYIANVGDSRAYLYRNNKLIQITVDHSWLNELIQDNEISEEEAKNFQQKNIITRALGIGPAVKIDLFELEYNQQDIFLLCSDGLSDVLENKHIQQIIQRGYSNFQETIDRLINFANLRGGPDNITAVLIQHDSNVVRSSSPKINFEEIPSESDRDIVTAEQKILAKFFNKTLVLESQPTIWKKNIFIAAASFIVILIVLNIGLVVTKRHPFFSSQQNTRYKLVVYNKNNLNDSIIIDNQLKSITPDTFLLPKGNHEILVFQSGYDSILWKIFVTNDTLLESDIDLPNLRLVNTETEITKNPTEISIFIDQFKIGNLADVRINPPPVKPGIHILTLKRGTMVLFSDTLYINFNQKEIIYNLKNNLRKPKKPTI